MSEWILHVFLYRYLTMLYVCLFFRPSFATSKCGLCLGLKRWQPPTSSASRQTSFHLSLTLPNTNPYPTSLLMTDAQYPNTQPNTNPYLTSLLMTDAQYPNTQPNTNTNPYPTSLLMTDAKNPNTQNHTNSYPTSLLIADAQYPNPQNHTVSMTW